MVEVYSIDNVVPVVATGTYVHPTAVIIGDVVIGAGCYIGPHASLRGDFGPIRIGEGSNIQDSCVLHTIPGEELIIEELGHIGHGAILHGCRIGRNALIGLGTAIMDGVVVGESSLVTAMALVKSGMHIPPRSYVRGNPATIVGELTEAQLRWKALGTKAYQSLASRALATMRLEQAETEVRENRPSLKVESVYHDRTKTVGRP